MRFLTAVAVATTVAVGGLITVGAATVGFAIGGPVGAVTAGASAVKSTTDAALVVGAMTLPFDG